MGYGSTGLGWIWILVLLVGVALLVRGLVLLRASSSHAGAVRERNSSRELLRLRYARGEITEEEMLERLRLLDGP